MSSKLSKEAQIAIAGVYKWHRGSTDVARRALQEATDDSYLSVLGRWMMGEGSVEPSPREGAEEEMRQIALAFRTERDRSDDALRMACAHSIAVDFDPKEHPALSIVLDFMFDTGDDVLSLAMAEITESL